MKVVDRTVAGEHVVILTLDSERLARDADCLRRDADDAEVAGLAWENVEVQLADEFAHAWVALRGSGQLGERCSGAQEQHGACAEREPHAVQANRRVVSVVARCPDSLLLDLEFVW